MKSILYLLPVLFFFVSCGGDDPAPNPKPKPEPGTETTHWIEETMRENYYWYDEIPSADKLNFTQEPITFFKSLLSDKDGKNGNFYSYIEEKNSPTRAINDTNNSYGFQFIGIPLSGTVYYAVAVLYVASGSPAADANLNRCDFIVEIDGKDITRAMLYDLFSGNSKKLSIANIDPVDGRLVMTGDIEIGPSRKIEDNPVHFHTVLRDGGRNVGYLVYNHFTNGLSSTDKTYDNRLREISKEFNSAGVNEFVLDLRYNPGGYLSCCQLMCAILAPQSSFGKSLGYMQYNDKHRPQKEDIPLERAILNGGENLNLRRLYVLTSSSSASASEAVISFLKPYMQVIVIGEQTEGKNVGSVTFPDVTGKWEMHPIVAQLFNSAGFTEYSTGFIPDYPVHEFDNDFVHFLPFGDKNEALLRVALGMMNGTPPAVNASRSFKSEEFVSSLDRFDLPGVIIDGLDGHQ